MILAAGTGSRISRWKDVPKPLLRLCGLPLIERTIRTAHRAGFKDFVVVTGYRGQEIQDAIGDGSKFDVQVRYVDNQEWEKANGISVLKVKDYVKDDFVLTMADHIVDAKTFKKLFQANLGTDDLMLVTDSRIGSIFDINDATKVSVSGDRISEIGKELTKYNAIDTGLFLCSTRLFEALEQIQAKTGDASLTEGVRILAAQEKARVEDIGSGWWQDVDTVEAYRHAEKLLIQSLRKPTDVFVSRHFNRPISLFFSKYLSRFSIRPDYVSFISGAVGFMAPFFLIQGEYWSFVMGAFLYHFSSVLDGCDGEIARLKFMESKRGQWVDTISDVISHYLFVAGITIGLFFQTANPNILLLGVLGYIGMTSLLYVMFQYLLKSSKGGSLVAFEQDYVQSVSGFSRSCHDDGSIFKAFDQKSHVCLLILFACRDWKN